MRQDDHNISVDSFMDELCKIAQSSEGRSLMSDFMGGIDPTGTKTFQYGMQDARGGGPSGVRRAVGTAGGLVGGAMAIPAAIGGTVGALKGFASGHGGVARRLISAGKGAVSGSIKPYTSLYKGVQGKKALSAHLAGKKLTESQSKNLQRLVKDSNPVASMKGSNLSAEQTQGLLSRFKPKDIDSARRSLTGEIAGGAGAIGLSGAISGGSTYMQYGKGVNTQQSVNKQLGRRGLVVPQVSHTALPALGFRA